MYFQLHITPFILQLWSIILWDLSRVFQEFMVSLRLKEGTLIIVKLSDVQLIGPLITESLLFLITSRMQYFCFILLLIVIKVK